jgi:hypothetical protein
MAKIKEVVQRCDLPFAVHDHFIHAVGSPSIRGGLHEKIQSIIAMNSNSWLIAEVESALADLS